MRISGIAVVIEYRDTREVIVIVIPISDIAQHYFSVLTHHGFLVILCDVYVYWSLLFVLQLL